MTKKVKNLSLALDLVIIRCVNRNPPTMQPFIDLASQYAHNKKSIDLAIKKVLDHGKYISGPEVAAFESALQDFTGSPYAMGCSSGTDALALILMAYGVKANDAVIVPEFTYCATAEAVALVGATPIFVDICQDTWTLDPKEIKKAYKIAESLGLNCKGVIPVDIFGLPANYDAIHKEANALNMWVMADGAQSFGSTQHGKKMGALASTTATSFFPAKPLGCYGDGGAVFAHDEAFMKTLKSLRVHGQGVDKYDNVRIGLNARLDTLQAAILLEKLAVYPDEVVRRQRVATLYQKNLEGVKCQFVPEGSHSVWAQFTIQLPHDNRAEIQVRLKERGVPTAIYYPKLLSQQKAYSQYPTTTLSDSATHRLVETVVSLPMHPYCADETVLQNCDIVNHVVSECVPAL